MENGVAVATVTNVSLSAATVNALLDNAAGVDPFGESFITFLGPLLTIPQVVTGSSGNDVIYGSTTNDTINAGAGNDYIRPRGGFDTIDAGAGIRDIVDYTDFTVGINANLQSGAVVSNDGNNTSFGTASGFEWIFATNFDDILRGTTGNNVMHGNDGDDTFYGQGGDDFYAGGRGKDTYHGSTTTGPGQWDKISYEWEDGSTGIHAQFLGGGTVQVTDTYGNVEDGFNINQIKGSQYDDTFIGSNGNDSVEGMGGDDLFDMGGGSDMVEYSHEEDAGGTHGVIVNLSGATISARIGTGLKTVASGKALDSLGGTDTLVSVEDVIGTHFTDYIVGSEDGNYLRGHSGRDTLLGMGGNDTLEPDTGGGLVDGGAGDDTAVLGGTRAEFRVVELLGGSVAMVDLRPGSVGEQTEFVSIEHYSFSGSGLGSGQLTPDEFYTSTVDAGGWKYGWYTSGYFAHGWHYESGWDFGYFHTGGSWAYGWHTFAGMEYGWFTYGAAALGWHYDYGGIGTGWVAGYATGAYASTMYGGWIPPAPAWPQGYGYSLDYGGVNLGWHKAGAWAYGWHYEYGWNYGVYGTGTGWVTGWFYHAGWEVGYHGIGTWTYGWFWDFGGWGSGWYYGAQFPYSYAGAEYA